MTSNLPKRILYLEDNPVDADLARRALLTQAPQMEVEIASTLAEAVELLAKDNPPYDMILSDLNLPDGSGLELLAHVRERRLPIALVIVTGSGDQASAIAALKAGANDYVIKRADYCSRLIHTLAAAQERFVSEFASRTRQLRVLYAEHNTFDIDLTRRHFAKFAPQIRLQAVESGLDVLAALPESADEPAAYDVVLLDFLLPGINALEVAKILRDERRLPLPVVLVTGSGSEDVVAEALRLGVADYLMKHAGYLNELPAVLEHAHRQAQLAQEQATLQKTTQRLRHLLSANPTILYACEVDGHQIRPVWISENMTRVYGYTIDECLQSGWWLAGLDEADRERAQRGHARLFTQHQLTQEYRFHDKSGMIRWVRDEMRLLLDSAGKPKEIVGSWSDITASRQASERQQLQSAALESTRDAVMITDLDSVILYVNSAFIEITGYAEPEVIGQKASLLRTDRHDQRFYDGIWQHLHTEGQWQGEIWNRRKNGDVHPQWQSISAVRDADGKPTHYVAAMTDLTAIRHSEERLEQMTHYDPLTGLPNRVLLKSLLQHAIERALRQEHLVGVLFLNLDKFKTINDSLGHLIADQVLLRVTDRLDQQLEGRHILGRLGADEFAIVIDNLSDPGAAEMLAFNLLVALDRPFDLGSGREVYARASIGISIFPQDGESAHDLLHHADAALHRAKSQGGNQIAFYTRELSAQALRRLDIEARLLRAMEKQELAVHFQPKIDLATGAITGAEALVRWSSPDGIELSPAEFIPLAEENGQIVAIGNWVLDEVCRQICKWNEAGYANMNVAVNVSVRQFRHPGLEDIILSVLAKHRIDPSQLTLELTETMLVENPEQTINRLWRLKKLGVLLSLDDFGTGYSSLSYLSRFPMDQLKIDRSFVANVVTDQRAANIASSIIDLAHRMQMKVVAEGVENLEQLQYLRKNHCDEIQGFYFCKPVPIHVYADLLRHQKTFDVNAM